MGGVEALEISAPSSFKARGLTAHFDSSLHLGQDPTLPGCSQPSILGTGVMAGSGFTLFLKQCLY